MKRTHKLLIAASSLVLAAVLSSCIFLPEKEESLQYSKDGTKVTLGNKVYKLAWSDEFDDTSLNEANWNRQEWKAGAVNNEVQKYSKDVQYSSISDDDTLKLIAKGSGSNWTSARIDTAGKYSFKYGYVEAKIKQPVAYNKTTESDANLLIDEEGNPVNNGVWPAFWMMPENALDEDGNETNGGVYGVWPCSGEIDIMEYSPSTSGNSAYATIHHALSETDTTDSYLSLGRMSVETPVYDNKDDWHTYGMLWTSGTLEAFYDGKSLGTVYANAGGNWTKWPYDQDFYIILNLAMGGVLGGAIDSGMKMAVYEIDYVRVYQ